MVQRIAFLFFAAMIVLGCDSEENVPAGYGHTATQADQTAQGYADQPPYKAGQPVPGKNIGAAKQSGTPSTSRLPPGTVHAQRAQIIDSQGFGKPIVAATVLIPQGWRTRGGVQWNAQALCGTGYKVDWQASSPDGSTTAHYFPAEHWQWNNMGSTLPTGCPTWKISNVRDYLQNLIQRSRPGARILDFRLRNDINKEYAKLNQTTPMPGGEVRTWVESGEALVAFTQNGADMRESVAVVAVFSLNRMSSPGMPTTEFFSGATLSGYAMRAPNGRLDFKLAEMIRKSLKTNPEWLSRITKHNAKISSIKTKGALDRAKITAQYGEDIRRMQADSRRLQNESFDRNSRETSEMIRGVETYNDPYHGDTVQLDNTYEHAYQLNDGSYVLTDNPDFNPYPIFGQDGQRLEVTQ